MQSQSARIPFTKWKSMEVMLAVLFLAAPFVYFPNIGGTGLRIPNNITVWLVANCIAWYSLYLIAKRQQVAKPKYFFLIIAFPILATLSGFIIDVKNPIEWLFRLLFIWGGLLFFVALFQNKFKQGRVDRILFTVVVSAFAQACIGIIQITLLDSIPTLLPKSVSTIPFGMFQQINNQSTYQVTALVIAVFLITRPYLVVGSAWKRILIMIFFSLSAFIISYGGSRIGALSILIALPFVIKGRWQYIKKNKSLATTSLIFVFIGVTLGATGSGFSRLADKTIEASQSYTTSERTGIYAVSLDLIKEEPLFGHGLGSFKQKWQYEKADYYRAHPNVTLIGQYVTHPHNEFLFWAVEGGIIAVIGMLFVIVGILVSLKGHNRHRWGAFLGFLLPIMLHTQVELPFYTSAVHWFLALFLMFVLMRHNTEEKKIGFSVFALQSTKFLSVIMIISSTLFLAHTLKANHELGRKEGNLWAYTAANNNLYFADIIESLQMKTMLALNIQRDSRSEGLQLFIDWGEKFLTREPSIQMFMYLAAAHDKLGNEQEMCDYFRLGSSIYPNNSGLANGVKFCNR